MKRRNKNSAYVVEEQSRGVGAIASQDLGLTARASGGEILARKRASGVFPAHRFAFRQGRVLPQPAREVLVRAEVPRQHYALDPYTGPGFRVDDVRLVSRPGGAQVHAGVILGDPPPAVAMGQFPSFNFARATPVEQPKLNLPVDQRAGVTAPKRGRPASLKSPERLQEEQRAKKLVRDAYNAGSPVSKEGAPSGTRLMSFYKGALKEMGAPLGSPTGPIHQVTYVSNDKRWIIASKPYWTYLPSEEEIRRRQAEVRPVAVREILNQAFSLLYPPSHGLSRDEWKSLKSKYDQALYASPPPYGANWKDVVVPRFKSFASSFTYEGYKPDPINTKAALAYIQSQASDPERARPSGGVCDGRKDGSIGGIADRRAGPGGARNYYVCEGGVPVPLPPGTEIPDTHEERAGFGEKILSARDEAEKEQQRKQTLNKLLIAGGAVGAATALVLFLRRR